VEVLDRIRIRVLGLLREIIQTGGRDAGMQVDIVPEVAPCNAIIEAIMLVIEAIEAEKRIMAAEGAVLIGDQDE
tara:strand:+ start:693 stop:914 length:222 start_codon:yes stop_codon:yes gene_type:complete